MARLADSNPSGFAGRVPRIVCFARFSERIRQVCHMSGKIQLEAKCAECGRALSVLTRQERRTVDHPKRVEVPIGKPICPVGHIYRMGPDEPYPE